MTTLSIARDSTTTALARRDPLVTFSDKMTRLERSLGWAQESQFGPRTELSIMHAALKLMQGGIRIGQSTTSTIEESGTKAANSLFATAAELIWGNSFGIGGGTSPRDKMVSYRSTQAMSELREVLAPYKMGTHVTNETDYQQLTQAMHRCAALGSELVGQLSPRLSMRKINSLVETMLGEELSKAQEALINAARQAASPVEKAHILRTDIGLELSRLGIERMSDKKQTIPYFSAANDALPRLTRERNAPLSDAISKLRTLPGLLDGSDENSTRLIAERQQKVMECFRDACICISLLGH